MESFVMTETTFHILGLADLTTYEQSVLTQANISKLVSLMLCLLTDPVNMRYLTKNLRDYGTRNLESSDVCQVLSVLQQVIPLARLFWL